MRVLMVEDELAIARPLQRALEREGYVVAHCETGADAVRLARAWEPDIVLLDRMLPDIDGMQVAREIRAGSRVPIIMVTARGHESDVIAGLEGGADDYVVKPFSVAELVARIRSTARRAGQAPRADGSWSVRDLTLDPQRQRLVRDGTPIDLTAKEFELLRLLIANAGEIVRREDLARAVWGGSAADAAATLDVHVSSVRKKLGDDPKEPRYIETVRGVGFRLLESAP